MFTPEQTAFIIETMQTIGAEYTDIDEVYSLFFDLPLAYGDYENCRQANLPHKFLPKREMRLIQVYYSAINNCYIITSHIHGKLKRFRSKNFYDSDSKTNIFCASQNLENALRGWIVNYKNRIYNRL